MSRSYLKYRYILSVTAGHAWYRAIPGQGHHPHCQVQLKHLSGQPLYVCPQASNQDTVEPSLPQASQQGGVLVLASLPSWQLPQVQDTDPPPGQGSPQLSADLLTSQHSHLQEVSPCPVLPALSCLPTCVQPSLWRRAAAALGVGEGRRAGTDSQGRDREDTCTTTALMYPSAILPGL